ncbi:asparagine synthetase B [Actinomadura sp. NBRC 104412]|uniref:asparagine synthetase B family protein n=1 Tax=Actinomadura sp. NBRC 104412 TaxID=3032203 RepID=UPI0024A30D68|nr:asparagine synthase-related protein [Actinomadura sp. NBRC 104412]GLZ07198.1 asparagine synthetase B [Actinomadura sp. NBRC 104412]
MADLFGRIRFGVTAEPVSCADGDTTVTWDPGRQTVTLVRDRLGERPLFYAPTSDGVLYSSTQDALLAHVAPVLDLDGLHRALAFTLNVPGVPWSGVHEVAPGTSVTVTPSGATTTTYWRLTAREHTDDLGTTVATIRDLLGAALEDAPAASLLSGGLDSSLLAALAGVSTTYEVDFPEYRERFVPTEERAAPDGPFAAEVAAHLGTAHHTLTLDAATLADPALRRRVVQAYGTPPGWGDRDRSAYLLYRAVREKTVLSGEGADELFGGYATFFDPAAQDATTFPWVVTYYDDYGPAPGALRPALDLPGHLADEYARAVAEVEDPTRIVAHLFLTRALPVLLARKNSLSGAAGLDVRTPFTDPRLVEYVYNVPWSMKTFDGREKSLLRAIARDLLPRSVLTRVKTAYPSTCDPAYLAALGREAARLVSLDHPVFEIADRTWLGEADPARPRDRNTVEWILNLAAWLDVYHPTLAL